MSDLLRQTIGNEAWWSVHEDEVKALLPSKFVEMRDQTMAMRLGFGLKVLGVDWRTPDEFGGVMVMLEKLGVLQRLGTQVRANPDRVFPRTILMGSG